MTLTLKLNVNFVPFYEKVWANLEKLLVIPLAILVLSIIILSASYMEKGEFITKGIDFRGGTEIVFSVGAGDMGLVRERFSQYSPVIRTLSTGEKNLISVETTEALDQEEVEALLSGIEYKDMSIKSFGPIVSASFFKEAQLAAVVAFIIMGIVIFVAFRSLVPSLAVMLSATFDLIVTIGIMNVLGIELGFASLAALLMLLGYSVDTDILLSTRILKSPKSEAREKNLSAMKTGLTYSAASIAAFIILFLVSTSSTLDSIAVVLIIGLTVDIPSTWIQNSTILKRYVSK